MINLEINSFYIFVLEYIEFNGYIPEQVEGMGWFLRMFGTIGIM